MASNIIPNSINHSISPLLWQSYFLPLFGIFLGLCGNKNYQNCSSNSLLCPFSKKLFKTVYEKFYPWVKNNRNDIKFIISLQVQPWHPSSTLVHEAVLAVSKLSENRTIDFIAELFEHQEEYFDTALVDETRLDTYKRLSLLAENAINIDRAKFLDLLHIDNAKVGEKGFNVGNKVTTDLKLHIKNGRSRSVHVSPTVFYNGVLNDLISSSWTFDDWKEWYMKVLR